MICHNCNEFTENCLGIFPSWVNCKKSRLLVEKLRQIFVEINIGTRDTDWANLGGKSLVQKFNFHKKISFSLNLSIFDTTHYIHVGRSRWQFVLSIILVLLLKPISGDQVTSLVADCQTRRVSWLTSTIAGANVRHYININYIKTRKMSPQRRLISNNSLLHHLRIYDIWQGCTGFDMKVVKLLKPSSWWSSLTSLSILNWIIFGVFAIVFIAKYSI